MDLSTSYPENLSYSIKELNNFSQSQFRVMTDHLSNSINAGEIFRVNLPMGLFDLRSLALHFNFTAILSNGSTGCTLHAPRYTSSLIERINIYFNNNLVSSINKYNLLYNTLADLQFSADSSNKRFLENYDPSVLYGLTACTSAANGQRITTYRATANALSASDTNRPMVIDNWLGLLGGECSSSVLDSSMIGQITIEFLLAPGNVCFLSASNAAGTDPTGQASYKLDNVFMTGSKITFNSDEYYDLVASKLQNGGLIIGNKDYYHTVSPSYQKSGNPSFNYNINANSLDSIIAVPQIAKYNSLNYLSLFGSQNIAIGANLDNGTTTVMLTSNVYNYTFNELLAIQGGVYSTDSTNNKLPNGMGDYFNQSVYFARNMTGLLTSQFFVNSTPVDTFAKSPDYIYEETLQNLGFKNQDTECSCHPGMLSLAHFIKYYFTQIVRFNNISGDSSFYKSGLAAGNSPMNITYQATFDGVCTDSIYINFFNVMTKIMTVGAGRQITII